MNIRDGMERLARRKATREGLVATYRDVGGISIVLRVSRGQSLLKLNNNQGGTTTQLSENDFFVPVGALVLGGVRFAPQPGAYLDVTEEDGLVHSYQLLKPGPNEECARLVDSKVAWRVHTKFIKLLP